MSQKPHIDNAPGLTWDELKSGWVARWQARTDLVKRGYEVKSVRLWTGTEDKLTNTVVSYIQDRCTTLQNEMLVWSRGGIEQIAKYDGTLKSLADCYQTDPDSGFKKKLRYRTRQHYASLLKKIIADHGDVLIEDIKARQVKRWHEDWSDGGKVAMAHSTIGMLRTIINFGMVYLECDQCSRLSAALHEMRFPMAKPRNEALTFEQANQIRSIAHRTGAHSIALAQAFQFECMLRQKDCIGEWVPVSEPGVSDVLYGNEKWIMGLRWEEIDEVLLLRHVTSKRQKLVEIPLRNAPMVMEELRLIADVAPEAELFRDMLPASGPIVVSEYNGFPYMANTFRKRWRALADDCGIPKTVRNMDSRAGAITEATDAGADLEHIRHAATHSDIAMTQRYSRDGAGKTANVMRQRVEHRNKLRTEDR